MPGQLTITIQMSNVTVMQFEPLQVSLETLINMYIVVVVVLFMSWL